MKKLWNKLCEVVPILWGILWLVIITVGSVSLLIFVINWFLDLLGVM